ncbi:orotate phosphoribosyltransferase [Salinisphaera sp. USBA-960]|uniref:orotate phosphoribosyltransferase n=1 Tax=Salinisphaera orenii TaxID=856731 RepID=UPI000DBE7475|nr:orotate phosphoribosyltransferase [Salifodinibacter halophilus]NNC27140.1 orotate phosphoribosyltransferase [Salifodinibacter halophilus]
MTAPDADASQAFLRLAAEHDALKFGEFTLKSGRVSPYFFNLGAIASGDGLRRLAEFYAHALASAGIAFDTVFGPAYKGIPLAAALATELAGRGIDAGFAYNRKEAKDHGEGGSLVGAPVTGRVVIIDDVMTAGTAVREAIETIRGAGGEVAAVLIALDRDECGADARSPTAALEADEGIPTIAVAGLADVLAYARRENIGPGTEAAIEAYRAEYGA